MNPVTASRTGVAALVVLVVLATPLGVTAVAADGPPQPPAAYYGQVLVGGDPAPSGLTVSARVDGTVEDTIQTDGDGSFGGAGALEEKIEVQAENGSTVSFWVDGEPTNATATWESGDNHEVTIRLAEIPAADDERRGSSGGGSSGGGGGGGAGAGPSFPPAVTKSSANIDPGTSSVGVTFPSQSSFERFHIQFQKGTDGRVTVSELRSTPDFAGPTRGQSTIAVADVEVPRSATDAEATVTATLRTKGLPDGVTPSSLRIEHFDAEAGDWETLETSVVNEGPDRLVIRANTPGFSLFAVTVARDDETTVGTPVGQETPGGETAAPPSNTDTAAPEDATSPVASSTPTEQSGLDPVPVVLGLVLVASVLTAAYIIRRG